MMRSRALGVAVAAMLTLGGAQATPATSAAEGALTVRPASGYHRLPLAYAAVHYLLAGAVALTSSVIAGYQPARKAAGMHPVEIIRGAT